MLEAVGAWSQCGVTLCSSNADKNESPSLVCRLDEIEPMTLWVPAGELASFEKAVACAAAPRLRWSRFTRLFVRAPCARYTCLMAHRDNPVILKYTSASHGLVACVQAPPPYQHRGLCLGGRCSIAARASAAKAMHQVLITW